MSEGDGFFSLLGSLTEAPDTAWAPVLVCHRLPLPNQPDLPCFVSEEGSADTERLGLGMEPAYILIRHHGDEFARLEGAQATEENLRELVRLYRDERRILAESSMGPERTGCDLVRLMLVQRRLSASIVAWKGLQSHEDPSTLCRLACQIACLAMELSRHEEALPLLDYALTHDCDEALKVKARSMLIQSHLVLGNSEDAEWPSMAASSAAVSKIRG